MSEQCFMCAKRRKFETLKFENIKTTRMPTSRKPVQVVLQHLANCIKTKLVFQPETSLCSDCLRELSEYDNLMVNLLKFQNRLTNQLQVMLSGKLEFEDEYKEIDSEVVAFEIDEHLADANYDTKEELIEVDEIAIDEDTDMADEYSYDDEDENMVLKPTKKRSNQECIVCGMTFKSKQELQKHIADQHDPKMFTCNICGVVRRDEEYLELHMNTHEGKTEKECRYCPKRFSRAVNTIRHMRIHWDKKKYQCEKCGERFSQDNMLYNHRLRHEAEENPLICSICNQSFKSRKTYNHHVLIHQENRPRHHCSLCSKSFTERYTLKMHMKTHGNATFTVPPTEEEESKEAEAAVTALVEVGEAEEVSCVICSTKFDSQEALERHLQHKHDVILK